MTFHIFIPARFQSSRLPGKPLSQIAGKTMLAHVIQKALSCHAISCTVLTDHPEIMAEAQKQSCDALMTPAECHSGTERVAYATEVIGLDPNAIVVNVQGDEPFISPKNIIQVASVLHHQTNHEIASLYQHIHCKDQLMNPNCVKVILNHQDQAICFSRACLPYARNQDDIEHLIKHKSYRQHIGLYAYRASFLSTLKTLKKSPIEHIECLEQMAWIQNGAKLQMAEALEPVLMDINTPEDLNKAQTYYETMAMA